MGYITYTCHCGASYVNGYMYAKGHSYEDGKCIHCGKEAPYVLLGDVNGDSKVDASDAYSIVMYYNEMIDLAEAQLAAADVNGDGTVDVIDAYYIILYYSEKISKFPQ